MKIGQIIQMITLAFSIIKELIKFYHHLEEKFGWGKNQGPDIKAAIRGKKRDAMDTKIVETFLKRGLPEPDRNVQAFVRETIHKRVSGKTAKKGKSK